MFYTKQELQDIKSGYTEALLWLFEERWQEDTGLGVSLDEERLSDDLRERIESICKSFLEKNVFLLRVAFCSRGTGDYSIMEQAGHDLYLTQHGCGAGFWDGDWEGPLPDIFRNSHIQNIGKLFTAEAKRYRELDLYTGDDWIVYHSGGTMWSKL